MYGEYKVRAVNTGLVWSDEEMAMVPNIEYQIVTNTIKNRADRFAGKQVIGRIAKLAGIAGKIVQKV
ncbi:MAG: hypothetical protein ACOCSE_00525 [Chitinivibrionales bacterium]